MQMASVLLCVLLLALLPSVFFLITSFIFLITRNRAKFPKTEPLEVIEASYSCHELISYELITVCLWQFFCLNILVIFPVFSIIALGFL